MSSKLKYSLDIGADYDITLLGTSTLGLGYRQANLLAILDYGSAATIADVGSTHASILSALATGTPSDPAKLIYLKFKTTNGDVVVLAQDWLAGAPTEVTINSRTIVINNASTGDIERIRSMLVANGFTSFTIS